MKKVLLVALVIIMCMAAFVGCSGTQAPAEDTATEAPAADTAAETPAEDTATEAPADDAAAEAPADDTAAEAPAKADEDIKVGFSVHFKTDDYGVICSEGFQSICDEEGIECEILDANGDPAKQLADIESFIAKGMDVIAISPMDENAIIDVCKKANDAGIPLVSITTMPDAEVACTINAGNYEFSEEVATILADEMGGQGKVAILDIPTNLWRTQQRLQAFEDVIAKTDIEIVDIQKFGTPEEAVDAAAAIMSANPDLTAIWGTYSNVLLGAGQAVKAEDADLVVGGVDCDAGILQLMKEGYVQAAAAQFPRAHGEESAIAAIALARGEEVPEVIDVPYKVYTADQYKEASMEVWGVEMD